eukprot:767712-Hanusia_phi.AAC.5
MRRSRKRRSGGRRRRIKRSYATLRSGGVESFQGPADSLLQAVRAREGAAAAQKAAQEEEKDRIFQKISKDILRRQAEEEEMLELQIELANQEAEERRVLVLTVSPALLG